MDNYYFNKYLKYKKRYLEQRGGANLGFYFELKLFEDDDKQIDILNETIKDIQVFEKNKDKIINTLIKKYVHDQNKMTKLIAMQNKRNHIYDHLFYNFYINPKHISPNNKLGEYIKIFFTSIMKIIEAYKVKTEGETEGETKGETKRETEGETKEEKSIDNFNLDDLLYILHDLFNLIFEKSNINKNKLNNIKPKINISNYRQTLKENIKHKEKEKIFNFIINVIDKLKKYKEFNFDISIDYFIKFLLYVENYKKERLYIFIYPLLNLMDNGIKNKILVNLITKFNQNELKKRLVILFPSPSNNNGGDPRQQIMSDQVQQYDKHESSGGCGDCHGCEHIDCNCDGCDGCDC